MAIKDKIQNNYNLKALSTFRIGGPAEYFLCAKTREDLQQGFAWAEQHELPVYVLGGGSNLLINDQGIAGLVIQPGNRELAVKGSRLHTGAGGHLAEAVSTATGHGLAGLEWAAGIPGSVGGAVRGNAGAFGGEMADAVEKAEVYDRNKDKFLLFSRRDCDFGYRSSVFQNRQELIIWQVILKLAPGQASEIKKQVEANLEKRKQAQPNYPSAGCVFQNVALADLKAGSPGLAERVEAENTFSNNRVPAGWLVDRADLKGKKIGGAKVSLEHGNFIVNTGGATAEDVIMLISYLKQQIRDNFGVQLVEEIRYFGF